MTKEERAKMLRERFRAKGGMPYVTTNKPRPFRYSISGRPWHMPWPEQGTNIANISVWLAKPDKKPRPKVQFKRGMGIPAPIRIAQKMPKKLIRTYRTAEVFAASQRRQ